MSSAERTTVQINPTNPDYADQRSTPEHQPGKSGKIRAKLTSVLYERIDLIDDRRDLIPLAPVIEFVVENSHGSEQPHPNPSYIGALLTDLNIYFPIFWIPTHDEFAARGVTWRLIMAGRTSGKGHYQPMNLKDADDVTARFNSARKAFERFRVKKGH